MLKKRKSLIFQNLGIMFILLFSNCSKMKVITLLIHIINMSIYRTKHCRIFIGQRLRKGANWWSFLNIAIKWTGKNLVRKKYNKFRRQKVFSQSISYADGIRGIIRQEYGTHTIGGVTVTWPTVMSTKNTDFTINQWNFEILYLETLFNENQGNIRFSPIFDYSSKKRTDIALS